METIVEYVVATGTTINNLTDQVNDYLCRGYVPNGSMAVSGTNFYQPMIRYQ